MDGERVHAAGRLRARAIAADAAFCRFNARRSTDPREPRLEERRLAGAVAFRDLSRADTFYYNRVLLSGPQDIDALGEFVAWYHAEGIPCGVEAPEPVLAPADWHELHADGFSRLEVVAFHHRSLAGVSASSEPLETMGGPTLDDGLDQRSIRLAGPIDLDVVLDLMDASNGSPPAPEDVRRRHREVQLDPKFPIFLFEQEGQVVSMATMFLDERTAWLGNAFTLRSARGRGHHLLLLRHRLEHARGVGCRHALADVEPGSASQRNVLRAGLGALHQTWRLSLAPGSGSDLNSNGPARRA